MNGPFPVFRPCYAEALSISFVGVLNYTTMGGSLFTYNLGSKSCQVGDLLLVCCAVEQASYTYTFNLDNAGWTNIVSNQIGTRTHRVNVWWNIIDGDVIQTNSNFSLTQSSADDTVSYCCIFRNVDKKYPFRDVTASTQNVSGDPISQAKDGLRTSEWVLFNGSNMYGTTYTPPASWTELTDIRSSTGSSNISTAICYRTGVTSTSASTMNAAANDYWASWTAVMRPKVRILTG